MACLVAKIVLMMEKFGVVPGVGHGSESERTVGFVL